MRIGNVAVTCFIACGLLASSGCDHRHVLEVDNDIRKSAVGDLLAIYTVAKREERVVNLTSSWLYDRGVSLHAVPNKTVGANYEDFKAELRRRPLRLQTNQKATGKYWSEIAKDQVVFEAAYRRPGKSFVFGVTSSGDIIAISGNFVLSKDEIEAFIRS